MSATERAIDGVRDWLGRDAGRARDALGNIGNRASNRLGELGSGGRDVARSLTENLNDLLNETFPGLGNDPGEANPPPEESSPFPGGQCPGVSYLVRVRYTDELLRNGEWRSRQVDSSRVVTGPVQGIVCAESAATSSLTIQVIDGNGVSVETVPRTGCSGCDEAPEVLRNCSFSVLEIERVDGQADDCGDPPPTPNDGGGGGGAPDGDWGDSLDPDDPNSPAPWGIDPPNGGLCFSSGGRLICYGPNGFYDNGIPTNSNRGVPPGAGGDPNDPFGCCASNLEPTLAQLGGNQNISAGQLARLEQQIDRVGGRLALVDQTINGFFRGADLALENLQKIQLEVIAARLQTIDQRSLAHFLATVDATRLLSQGQSSILQAIRLIDSEFDDSEILRQIREVQVRLPTVEANAVAAANSAEAQALRSQQEAQTGKEISLRLLELENTYPVRDRWQDSKFAADRLRLLDESLDRLATRIIDAVAFPIAEVRASFTAVLGSIAALSALTVARSVAVLGAISALGGQIVTLNTALRLVVTQGFARVLGRQSSLLSGQQIIRQRQQIAIDRIDQIEWLLQLVRDNQSLHFPDPLSSPFVLTETTCELVDGVETPVSEPATAQSLVDVVSSLSGQLALAVQSVLDCSDSQGQNVPPSLIKTGLSTVREEVDYVEISPEVRQIELIITGTIPSSIKLFGTSQSSEPMAKFGSVSVAYNGSTGGQAVEGFHEWCWTRRTLLTLGEPLRSPRFVRVFAQRGLSWAMYDTGIRT